MLSGKLPTGTVSDQPGTAGRGRRAHPQRTERPDGGRRVRATRDDGRRIRATRDDERDGDLAVENRRLKERLAAERAERRAVIDRYERILADRAEADREARPCADDGAGERTAARLRRVLSRLRCLTG